MPLAVHLQARLVQGESLVNFGQGSGGGGGGGGEEGNVVLENNARGVAYEE